MHSILDMLSSLDEETERFDRFINQAFMSGQSVSDAVHSFFNTDSPHESELPVQHCDDSTRRRQTGDEPQASGRIQKGWFGDGSGI